MNGRAIRDRQLARSVAMAFGSVLDPGRYPLGIVWLDLPSDEVDVNVHPQKAEVRFARGRELYDDVTRALAARLAEAFRSPAPRPSHSIPRAGAYPIVDEPPRSIGGAAQALSDAMTERFSAGGFVRANERGPHTPSPAAESDPWGLGLPEAPAATARHERPTPLDASIGATAGAMGGPTIGASPHAQSSPPVRSPAASTLQSEDAFAFVAPRKDGLEYATLRFLAQVRSTFLVCEGLDGIYVLDQHAAAERVNYARLREQFKARTIATQQLLVPEIVQVRSSETSLVEDARDELLGLGVDARVIGDGRIAVHGVPALLRKAKPEQVLRDVLDELAKTGERKFGDAIDLVLATMACHGSVRAGDTLHPDECVALLRELDAIDFAGYCPHGRPIVTMVPFFDLEKKVGRR